MPFPKALGSSGKDLLKFRRIDQVSGVKTSNLRSARFGLDNGMGTRSGAEKMILSVLAETNVTRRACIKLKNGTVIIMVCGSNEASI